MQRASINKSTSKKDAPNILPEESVTPDGESDDKSGEVGARQSPESKKRQDQLEYERRKKEKAQKMMEVLDEVQEKEENGGITNAEKLMKD